MMFTSAHRILNLARAPRICNITVTVSQHSHRVPGTSQIFKHFTGLVESLESSNIQVSSYAN